MMAEHDNTTICAILAYLLVGIIWYFADEEMQKSPFVKYHVKQGLLLLIAAVIVSVARSFFVFIPIIGWLISAALTLIILIAMIVGLINALNKKKQPMPIIGTYAEQIFTF